MTSKRADKRFETETARLHKLPHPADRGHMRSSVPQTLHVMKFGGTSVGDAACIRKVVELIAQGCADSHVVAVVSAMAGVTNKLIEAAIQAESGNRTHSSAILEELRKKHEVALRALIHSDSERDRLSRKIGDLLDECGRWCETTAAKGELTAPMRDLIASLGERLSAPLVSVVLAEHGVASEAVDASEVVVTDGYHGGADPKMDATRRRCEARLRPLLQQGVVPIVTGFIGATETGVLTTLGRGGSDFSATILGAALEADEITIWTDVDGILTADPHLVPAASTIPEISYRDAAELAYFGAKVLHPKTLRPVMQSGIPVWIRNTFAPENPGTKITPAGHSSNGGVKGLTAVSDAALITLCGPAIRSVPDVASRARAAAASVRTDVLMICHSDSCNRVCLVVAASAAQRTVDALRLEFAHAAAHEDSDHLSVDATVAILTVVGHNLPVAKGIVDRAVDELSRENVNIIASAPGFSEHNVSFVVARKDIKAALATTHREFQTCILNLPEDSRSEAQLL